MTISEPWPARRFPVRRRGRSANHWETATAGRDGLAPTTFAVGSGGLAWAPARPVPCCPPLSRGQALAHDPQQAAGLVDGGNGESGGLADAQASAIDQAEAAAVDRVGYAAQNASHLGMGKRLRQAPLLREPDLFLKSAQSVPRVSRYKNWIP